MRNIQYFKLRRNCRKRPVGSSYGQRNHCRSKKFLEYALLRRQNIRHYRITSKLTIKSEFIVYVSLRSSYNDVINVIARQVNRNLNDRNCVLTATLTYKNESDEINVYLTVHSNAYVADTIIFPLKSSIEIKVSYLKITDVLKSKIRIADNSEWNDITRRYPFEETYISFDICFLSRRERNTI